LEKFFAGFPLVGKKVSTLWNIRLIEPIFELFSRWAF
jgi:hypothetical protein